MAEKASVGLSGSQARLDSAGGGVSSSPPDDEKQPEIHWSTRA